MSPRLLRLAAEMMDHVTSRGCNDYTLPDYLTATDIAELVELANRANFGDLPRSRWPKSDTETVRSMRRGTQDFVVKYALAFGLREMAKAGGA